MRKALQLQTKKMKPANKPQDGLGKMDANTTKYKQNSYKPNI